jgi:imidazole glycerol-phosphate synthase subunit HisH
MLCIVDYGSGNIAAIGNLCRREKIPYCVVNRPAELDQGTHYILPGVGAFDPTMETLESSGLLSALEDQVHGNGKPILGICVGMQLLANSSDEGTRPGLGWIPGKVGRIQDRYSVRTPHMGWNSIETIRGHPILDTVDQSKGFYFLHSYYFEPQTSDHILAFTDYGGKLPCVIGYNNTFGAQFHPEKSHSNGIRLISNFSRLESCYVHE